MTSRSRKIIYYIITVVKHNENHGSRRNKPLFLVSRKTILQNHASRLLWKSWFTGKKLVISHFTRKKKGLSRVTKIPLPPSLLGCYFEVVRHSSWYLCFIRHFLLNPWSLGLISTALWAWTYFPKQECLVINPLVTKNGTKQINNTNFVFLYSSADACAGAVAMSININRPLKSVLYICKKSGHCKKLATMLTS